MKVTYSDSIGNGVNLSSISSRVLTENLMNNDKFDPIFSTAIMTIPVKVQRYLQKNLFPNTQIGKSKYLESSYMKFLRHLISQNYQSDFLNSIQGDYLLYNMFGFDYNILTYVLNNGVRVVAGGCEVNMYSFDHIRDRLILYGTKKEALKNLLLIKGNVTPRTDLYTPIKNWKDCLIPNIDLKYILDAKEDYIRSDFFRKVKNIINSTDPEIFKYYIWPEVLTICFNSKCIWGKCRFCRYCILEDINFIEELSADEIIEKLWALCKNLNCYYLFFADDYFWFSEKRIKVMDALMKRGVKFCCQSGILLLKNEEYTKKICKYFSFFAVGVEKATDFSLKMLNKGYKWKDVQKAFENIKKYATDYNSITVNLIIDAPIESIEDANLSYKRHLDIKEELEANDIKVIHTISILQIADQKMLNDFSSLGYIRKPQSNKSLSGKLRIAKELKKYIDFPDKWLRYEGVPYERIDKNGNLLDSDIEIVDEDILERLQTKIIFID